MVEEFPASFLAFVIISRWLLTLDKVVQYFFFCLICCLEMKRPLNYSFKLILVLLGFCYCVSSNAQQDPQFSMNMFSNMGINPGYAGSQGLLNASVINRQQWMGFKGNPKSTLFTVHTPVNPFGISSGVGLTILDDRLGFEQNMALNLSYAYRMSIGPGHLGLGISGGLLNKTLKGEWSIPDSDFHTSATQDPAIPAGEEVGMAFDMGAGLFYNTDDFYVGFSTTHLLQPTIDYGLSAKTDMKRHYYLTAGYNYNLPNPILELQPSILAKYDGASMQLDVNAMVIYNKRFWGGVSYRLGDAVIIMAGAELTNGMRVGIAYDFTTSAIAAYSNGSVEFMVSYSLEVGADKASRKYRSIRLL